MELEPKRARRRRITETVAKRRHSSYAYLLSGDASQSRHAATSPHHWAKKGISTCGCHKRKHGVPRLDQGMCSGGARDRIYRWRALNRVLEHLVRRGGDLERDDVVLSAGGNTDHNCW